MCDKLQREVKQTFIQSEIVFVCSVSDDRLSGIGRKVHLLCIRLKKLTQVFSISGLRHVSLCSFNLEDASSGI